MRELFWVLKSYDVSMRFRPRQLTKSIDIARRKMSFFSKRFPTKCTEQGIWLLKNKFPRQIERVPFERRITILLTGSIVVFALLMSFQNGVFWPQGSLLFGVQTFSLQDCPKILLHLFEEDTLLFLLVGTLWLKAVYQVVIFVSEICQFYVCQKSVK